MGLSQNWFLKRAYTKLRRSTNQYEVVFPDSNPFKYASVSDGILLSYLNGSAPSTPISLQKPLTMQDMAAIKIQAVFRGHLARRALRALRSLVKLQAMVRGAYVRKQARIALNCMCALARLQINVRTRQLLHHD